MQWDDEKGEGDGTEHDGVELVPKDSKDVAYPVLSY
jgi:hypothetical protein